MCKCIKYWVHDSSVQGTHDKKPLTCGDYIKALEDALKGAYPPDSLRVVRVQESLGVLETR